MSRDPNVVRFAGKRRAVLALALLGVFLLGASSQLRQQITRSGAVILQRREAVAPIDTAGGKMVGIESISVFEPGAEQNRLLGLRLDWNAFGLTGANRYSYLDLHEIDAGEVGFTNP